MTQIVDRVREALQRAGYSEAWLAEQLELSQSALNRALNRNNHTYKHLNKIADILGVPVDWIRNGGPAPWEEKQTVSDTSTDDIENHPLVIELKTRCISMCERYLDLVDLCKENKLPVSTRSADEARAFINLLYGKETIDK